ncbi:MAG: hypothetical protein V1777_04200 [Candidatus Micrarchaeota archaeon]
MIMHFLVSRPEHEDTVFYLSVWSKELLDKAVQKGFQVLDCHREKASAKTVEAMLKNHLPELVLFNGHGSENAVFGHNNEVLVEKDRNDGLLKNKIVFSRSCRSADGLGPSAVQNGCRAFIGYEDDFAFWIDHANSAIPLNDKFARPFFKASNQVIHSLLSGNTALEANQRSKAVFDEEIKKFLGSAAPPEAEYILPLLYWNKINQVVVGDQNAKLSE